MCSRHLECKKKTTEPIEKKAGRLRKCFLALLVAGIFAIGFVLGCGSGGPGSGNDNGKFNPFTGTFVGGMNEFLLTSSAITDGCYRGVLLPYILFDPHDPSCVVTGFLHGHEIEASD